MSETTTRSDRRPYPAYRDSGTGWLGDIPSHWDVKRLKFSVRMYGGGTPSKDNAGFWTGEIPWVSPKDMGGHFIDDAEDHITNEALIQSATRLVPEGAVLVVVRSGVLKHTIPVGITRAEVALNQDLKALVPSERLRSDYLTYLIRGHQAAFLDAWRKVGATVESLEVDQIGNTQIPLPPLDEQRAIAVYLDRETERIDALIARKERHIGLLREHRQAVVSTTVTQGLDPGAPTADSGHEWTGRIPAHWSVKPLMHLTPNDRQIMYGIVLPGPHVEGGVPIVKAGSVAPGKLRLSKLRRTDPVIEAGYVRSRLKGGDIVYAIRGSIGAAELVPAELEGANLTQDAARIAPRAGVHGPWLLHAVRSSAFFAQLEAGSLGAAVKGINIRDLKRGLVPVPPPEEQRAIAAHLDAETARIDALAATVRTSIARLREYRAALIAAAVTGRIDVRPTA